MKRISLVFCLSIFAFASQPRHAAEASDTKTTEAEPTATVLTEIGAPKLILVSWDGAGDVLIDRLLEEGHLPNLSRLAARGSRAAHAVGTWPTKTAPSHATIYTGCGPGVHGITDNGVAHVDERSSYNVTDTSRGFSSLALKAEPLFVTTALEGLDTAVLAATHYSPSGPIEARFAAHGAATALGTYRSFSSFEERILPSGVLSEGDLHAAEGWTDLPTGISTENAKQLELVAGDQVVYGLLFDDPNDPTDGLDALLLRRGSKNAEAAQEQILKPREASPDAPAGWSEPFIVGNAVKRQVAHLYFRLFELAPDGSELTLYRRETTHAHSVAEDEDRAGFLAAGSASYDDPMRPYQLGRLGPPLMRGGDGEAEERLLEAYAFDIELLTKGFLHARNTWRPEVIFHYSPHLDQAGHAWLAALDPRSPLYDAAVGPRLWRVYVRIADMLDRWLGTMMDTSDASSTIALVSDHGMTFTHREVAVNRILEDAGLLSRDATGRIDLSKTKIVAADSVFFLRVNGVEWKDGIVEPEERAAVVRQAASALLAARDPDNGRAVVSQVFSAESLSHLDLGRWGGDLYLDSAEGYYPVSGFSESIVRSARAPWGAGTHGHWRQRRDMHAIFYVAGPNVASGVELPALEQQDIAPTLAALLGIRAPADSCGRVAHEALRRPVSLRPSSDGTDEP